jgi:hypothetical protein
VASSSRPVRDPHAANDTSRAQIETRPAQTAALDPLDFARCMEGIIGQLEDQRGTVVGKDSLGFSENP